MNESQFKREVDDVLSSLKEERLDHLDPATIERTANVLSTTLEVFSNSMGECRQAVPFSTLRPVIDSQGNFRWCCNHDPEHCAAGIV